jgi:hypothetical protein
MNVKKQFNYYKSLSHEGYLNSVAYLKTFLALRVPRDSNPACVGFYYIVFSYLF